MMRRLRLSQLEKLEERRLLSFVSLTATKDSTLYETVDAEVSNGLGDHLFVGNGQDGFERRALIAFDVSSIPFGSTILKSELSLAISQTSGSSPDGELSLYQLFESWGEGLSHAEGDERAGAPAEFGDASWRYRVFDKELWSDAGGGDYLRAPRVAVAEGGSVNADLVFHSLEESVQSWVDEPDSNAGWVITASDAEIVWGLWSKDSASGENPRLDVEFLYPFDVSSVETTDDGLSIEFNANLDLSELDLSDVVVTGPSGPTIGTIVVSPSLRQIRFVQTAGTLEPGKYSVVLRSGDSGFKSQNGALLFGGEDYLHMFTVADTDPDTVVVGIPDFVRGPRQDVYLPANSSAGIPVSVNSATGIRSVDFRIRYDPDLLTIHSATLADGMSEGSSVIINTVNPGLAVLSFASPESISSGHFVNLEATVPSNAEYGLSHVLDIQAVSAVDAEQRERVGQGDDSVHIVAYLGDVTSNGTINSLDATRVAMLAAGLDERFSAFPLTPPGLVGDVTSSGRVNASDAAKVAQFASLIRIDEIPPIPGVTSCCDVVNGGFEGGPEPIGPNFPKSFGIWGGDSGTITGEDNGIRPMSGERMYRFDSTGEPPGLFSSSNVWQLIDIRPFRNAIQQQGGTATAEVFFNRVRGDAETDTRFLLDLYALPGSPSMFPTQVLDNEHLARSHTQIEADALENSWERASVSLQLPLETEFLAIHIAAFENVFDDPQLPELDGHYADAVSVSVNAY